MKELTTRKSCTSAHRARIAAAPLTLAVTTMSLLWAGCSSDPSLESSGVTSQALSTSVVISQVYGGGGNSGAPFASDFVELFNRGSAPVSLNGLSIQYASATGATWTAVALSNKTIDPGHYYLVRLAGGATGAALPAPDETLNINMSGTNGKVALVNGTTPLTCAADAGTDASVNPGRCLQTTLDLVGYGTSADFEGTGAVVALSNSTSASRKGAGCIETDDNAGDFSAGAVTPRNSLTAPASCSSTPADSGVDAVAEDAGPDALPETSDAAADSSVDPDAGEDAGDDGAAEDAAVDAGPEDAGTDATDAAVPTNTTGLVLSQIYGGGGNSGATFNRDFVELFNRSSAPISLAGLSIQYGSAAGNFATSLVDGGVPNLVPLPNVSVPAGRYFLVAMGTASATVGGPLPAADFEGTAAMAAGDGKIALARVTTSLACGATGARCSTANIVDMIGYGVAADFEGVPAAALSSTKASFRKGGGCVDTNYNVADTTAATPAPRNSATPVNDCSLDAGTPDAGPVDAGQTDAGKTDAGKTDGGKADAGNTDAGRDAGPTVHEAGKPDAGSPVEAADAGTTTNPDLGAGAATRPEDSAPDESSGGCSVATPARGPDGTFALSVFAALGLVVAARRKRTQR